MVRVLLYDDNNVFREAMEDAFAYSKKICLTKSFEDASRAVINVREYQPDVVLMDIEMPKKSGLDALSEITLASPNTKVLVQTQFKDDHRIFTALTRGAWGYVLKTNSIDELEDAITEVHKGGIYYSREIASKVRSFFLHQEIRKSSEYIPLTDKEAEVLNYLADGMKNKEIADKMYIAAETVKTHLKNIYSKLHVTSRSQAVKKAIENKLV